MSDRPHVLIIEDSPQIAEHLAKFAEAAECTVVATVATEDDAIATLERHRVDIALVDLQLAQGTGFGFMRHVRKRKPTPMALVVITNHAVAALKVAAFEAGCDYFLDKSKDWTAITQILVELAAGVKVH